MEIDIVTYGDGLIWIRERKRHVHLHFPFFPFRIKWSYDDDMGIAPCRIIRVYDDLHYTSTIGPL